MLIARQQIPQLAGWQVLKREVPFGHSRFDLLLAGARNALAGQSNPVPCLATGWPCFRCRYGTGPKTYGILPHGLPGRELAKEQEEQGKYPEDSSRQK